MTLLSKESKKLREDGWLIADPAPSYRPGGYPKLGLAPLATQLSSRSTAKLRAQLEKAEHDRGNLRFQALGITRMDPRLANELVSVYLGLAEKYNGVFVDLVNFASDVSSVGQNVLACATSPSTSVPTLHALSYEIGSVDVRDILAHLHAEVEHFDPRTVSKALSEAQWLGAAGRRRDLAAHGAIQMSECFSHPQCYGTLQTYWAVQNAKRTAAGQPVRSIPALVSEASIVFIHEFGHVVESAVRGKGPEAYRYVIEALEDGILRDENGHWLLKDRELREEGLTRKQARLINYPAHFEKVRGEGELRRTIRRVVGEPIGWQLGRYSKTARDEIFAEAFSLAIAAKDPDLRERLRPFRQSLVEVGVACARRRR